ncbi:hypothetical protein HPB50_006173 [Hyalomma asiaticum]|uniref:Uncharacterized protein n=1 Tax=Hyalomma asiaticum TaxID=266040 RepID=A0ACB7SKR9_HYAAI|nr:hypothetical protein HPB50_006173 [Hyalomma asiaticum]
MCWERRLSRRKLCVVALLAARVLVRAHEEASGLELLFAAKTRKADCPLRVVVPEQGTWCKAVASYLQGNLNLLKAGCLVSVTVLRAAKRHDPGSDADVFRGTVVMRYCDDRLKWVGGRIKVVFTAPRKFSLFGMVNVTRKTPSGRSWSSSPGPASRTSCASTLRHRVERRVHGSVEYACKRCVTGRRSEVLPSAAVTGEFAKFGGPFCYFA